MKMSVCRQIEQVNKFINEFCDPTLCTCQCAVHMHFCTTEKTRVIYDLTSLLNFITVLVYYMQLQRYLAKKKKKGTVKELRESTKSSHNENIAYPHLGVTWSN